MLFAKDDLRVNSASYAVVPWIKPSEPGPELECLIQLRAVVAYLYSQPHDVFDNIFLTPEDCSLIVVSPDRVSEFLVRPHHHTTPVGSQRERPPADQHHNLEGYAGYFNLSQPFWLEAGSRIYPPVPHITLNISQDLASDIRAFGSAESSVGLVLDLLQEPEDQTLTHIFTALHWYNFANEQAAGPDRALLNLAIAFEALLMLPRDAKTDRFVDAVSLLLGRTDRIDVWARQFYDARSRVAHEGRGRELHYYHEARGGKVGARDGRAAPLMFYGRQIFRMCVATLMTGSVLARRGDLRQKLTAHTERLTAICSGMRGTGSARERLAAIAEHVAALRRYVFLASGQFQIPEMLGAARTVAAAIIELGESFAAEADALVAECAAPKNGRSDLEQLQTIRSLHDALQKLNKGAFSEEMWLLDDLVYFIWMNTIFIRIEPQNPNGGNEA
ncbi:MAG: hypothetical protein AB7O98_18240 [Hyphomonadaceae bacterium]